MQRYQILINREGAEPDAPTSLDAPSLPIALIVADINLGRGTAEIWQEDRRVARVRKRRGTAQAYWELY